MWWSPSLKNTRHYSINMETATTFPAGYKEITDDISQSLLTTKRYGVYAKLEPEKPHA